MVDINELIEIQKKFSDFLGLPGYEDEVSSYILEMMRPYVDEIWKDPLGNILAIKEGTNNESGQRILLDAHMDEVGFMISHVEPSGYLRFVLLGRFDERIFLAQSVLIQNSDGKRFHGIIGSKPPHLSSSEERKSNIPVTALYIDIGMFSADEVLASGINVGSVGTFYHPFVEFPNGMIRGKALDDRVGCNIMIQVAKILHEQNTIEDTILFSFSVQEEVGLRGARTAAYALDPTMALAIETTTAGDTPGIRSAECPAVIGQGPSVSVADNTLISSHKINKRIFKNAELLQIPYQIKKPKFGGNNAGVIHLTKKGVPTSVISVPCRYLHTPVSLLKVQDIVHAIQLIEAFIKNPAKI